MEALRLLPARESPLPGESLDSLVRRTACAMGYESVARLRSLLPDRDRLPLQLHGLEPGPNLNGLSELLGISVDDLLSLTVHRHAASLVFEPGRAEPINVCDRKTRLRYFTASVPICPRCLQSEPAVERLLWRFEPTAVCLDHCCLLLRQCPACQGLHGATRLDARRCGGGFDLTQCQVETVAHRVLMFAERFQAWLATNDNVLWDMPPAAAFWWAERLKTAALKTPAWLVNVRGDLGLPQATDDSFVAWLAAAEMLDDWPHRFEQFLDVFQTVTKHRTSATGVGRSFGTLLRKAHWFEQQGYPVPADALRSYLLQHYSRGHLSAKVCLFEDVNRRQLAEKRPWMSQTEAARKLRIRGAAITDLVQRGLLVGEVHASGQHERSTGLVSRDSVERLQAQLCSALRVHQASQRLGISRHRILELIQADLLPGAVRTQGGWLIPLAAVEELAQLYCSLATLNKPTPRWLTTREATQRHGRSGLTFVRLLELVKSGQLPARRDPDYLDFRGLRLHQKDLRTVLPYVQQQRDYEQGFPLNRLSRCLVPGRTIKEVVLRKWITAGLLPADGQGRIWSVQARDVQKFRATYCLADEACRMLTITRSTLARWEADGRITAVYSRRNTPGAGASVFRRADVEGLLGQANCQRRRKSVAGVRSHDARHPKERPHEHHVNDE